MKPGWSLPALAVFIGILLFAGCTVGEGGWAPAIPGESIPIAVQTLPAKVLQPGQAVLVRGSESVRGIAGFGRNAIPALYGEYALPDGSGAMQIVSVWFTRGTLVLDEGWSPLSCPGLPAGIALSQSGPDGEGQFVVVASTADYRLVLRLPAGFGSPCRFISVLIDRFRFFMSNAIREEDLSLPAFLQL